MAAEQPQDKYVLRLPDGMRERLKNAAAVNTRSMNAEIVARLQYAMPGGAADTEYAELADRLAATVQALHAAQTALAEANHDREMLRNDLKVATESLRAELSEARADNKVLVEQLNVEKGRRSEFFDLEIERERQRQERRVLDELRDSFVWPDPGDAPDARPVVVTLMRALLPDTNEETKKYAQFRGSEFLSGVPVDRIGALKGVEQVAEKADEEYRQQLEVGIRKYQEESASYVASFLKRLGWKVMAPKKHGDGRKRNKPSPA